jgi:hypothetical protein
MPKVIGLVLVALGLLALVYGGFNYTGEQHKVDVGPLKIRVDERERVKVPQWVGIAAVAGGALLLAFGPKGRK